MNAKKLLFGAIAGTVIAFILDYLVYGILLRDTFTPVPNCDRDWPEFAWLVPGLFIMLLGFTYIYMKGVEAGTKLQQGIRYGLVFALVVGVAMNLIQYSITITHELSVYLTDMVYSLVKWSIVGIVVAYATGMPGGSHRGKDEGGGGGQV